MPQGLQVWNAAGALILDIGTRPFKIVSSLTFSGTTVSASIPGLGDGTPLYQVSLNTDNREAEDPNVSISGSTITVSGGSGASGSLVQYGFY